MTKTEAYNSFTYGFEIEGAFSRKIVDPLVKRGLVEKHGDGSVRVDKYKLPDYIEEPELAIGVFDSFTDMIDVMSLFNPDNYVWNSTCGLHIHIKPKLGKDALRASIGDRYFLETIQRWSAENCCSETQARLRSSDYCKAWRTSPGELTDLRYQWNRSEKYKFVRNHHSLDTFEFRFFSCCEHKVENVTKFFNFFMKALTKVQPKVELDLSVGRKRNKVLTINLPELVTNHLTLEL